MSFKSIDIKDFNENIFKIISEEWMLVTSGSKEKFNTMTASWGFAGFMWRKPVVNIVIPLWTYNDIHYRIYVA